MDLRIRASECRRQAGRLEELARAAQERASDRCRDQRGEEQALIGWAAVCEERARQLEAAAGRS